MQSVKPTTQPSRAPVYLKVAEVAERLRLRPRTIYQMVNQNRIPYRKAGGRLLFEESEIDRWTKESARG
jgi:excisionase family DNA binding protein